MFGLAYISLEVMMHVSWDLGNFSSTAFPNNLVRKGKYGIFLIILIISEVSWEGLRLIPLAGQTVQVSQTFSQIICCPALQIRRIKKPKNSQIHAAPSTPSSSEGPHLCLPPQVHPIITARPPALLHHLQPPTTTSSPCWMDRLGAGGPDSPLTKTGTRQAWELYISWHIWSRTKAWKSKLDVDFFFYTLSWSTTPTHKLFICHYQYHCPR